MAARAVGILSGTSYSSGWGLDKWQWCRASGMQTRSCAEQLQVPVQCQGLVGDTHIVVGIRASSRGAPADEDVLGALAVGLHFCGQKFSLWACTQQWGPVKGVRLCRASAQLEGLAVGRPRGTSQWQEIWPELGPQTAVGALAIDMRNCVCRVLPCVHSNGGQCEEPG